MFEVYLIGTYHFDVNGPSRLDVMHCDLFFANLLEAKKVSIGKMIEYGWADAFRKPIINVIEKRWQCS